MTEHLDIHTVTGLPERLIESLRQSSPTESTEIPLFTFVVAISQEYRFPVFQ
jgi:hypothetical protein